MDANFIQKRMQEIQRSDNFRDVFSKIVSGGRAGYKTIIEKKPVISKCNKCQTAVDGNQKFCHECGAKIEKLEGN